MKTVALAGKKGAGRVASVDDEDYKLVMQYRWWLYEHPEPQAKHPEQSRLKGPYAITTFYPGGRKTSVMMHKLITGWPLTDHIDHDGLNNQRHNLRPATGSQNLGNQRIRLGAKHSQYKGVSWNRARCKWTAYVCIDGTQRHLGVFAVEEDAALAYNAAALDAFGEYACLNEVPARGLLSPPEERENVA